MILLGAKIYTMDDEKNASSHVIERGYIRVQGGKITDVGEMPEAPRAEQDEDIVDMSGKIILPGFIDAHTHIGIHEDGLSDEGDDINEMADPFTPHLRALDAINPLDRCFSEARAAGVTSVVVSPGSSNPIGGQICAVKTAGRWIDKMVIAEPLAIKLAFGENPKTVYSEKAQPPTTRMTTAAIIRENLAKAQRYMRDKEKAVKKGDDMPELDVRMEPLIPLLKREIKAHIHAHRAYDVLTGVRIAREFGIDFTIVHCTEGHLIADILGEMKANIICGPLIIARTKPELSNLTAQNCARLYEAGVNVAICTDHPVIPEEYLPISMQVARAGGMDDYAALAAITISAAKAAGIEKRVGSITPGKDADILVYSTDPMGAFSKPETVFIDGVAV